MKRYVIVVDDEYERVGDDEVKLLLWLRDALSGLLKLRVVSAKIEKKKNVQGKT